MGPPPSPPAGPGPSCLNHLWNVCLAPAEPAANGAIFGFAEFMGALALLLVLYTISDIHYRFRIAISWLPLHAVSFWALSGIGVVSLASDFWFAKEWPLPVGLTDQTVWHALLALLFLIIVILWIWLAFMRPPIFSTWNAKKFARQLYTIVLRGSDDELKIMAQELARSAASLVNISKPVIRWPDEEPKKKQPTAPECAYQILLLLGSRRLCRHIVSSSSITAVRLFQEMSEREKYQLPLGQFGANITTEALLNKDSPLYHEDHGHRVGLLGYFKPFSNAVYGNFRIVEGLEPSPLDIDLDLRWKWDSDQFERYCRVVLLSFKSYIEDGYAGQHSYALHRAFDTIGSGCSDIRKLDGVDLTWPNEHLEFLRSAAHFARDAIEVIAAQKELPRVVLRPRDNRPGQRDVYQKLAELIFELVKHAAYVSSPADVAWLVQHNTVWTGFFRSHENSLAWKYVRFKVRRLLYDEITRWKRMRSYVSASVLGYCLNVLGLQLQESEKTGYGKEEYPLKKAVLAWTRENYLRLRAESVQLGDAALSGGISFDEANGCLVKTYRSFLGEQPAQEFLNLEPVKAA